MTAELPDMSAPELDAFLADNAHTLQLTSPFDTAAYRIRRRRRSIERRAATGEDAAAAHQQQQQHGGVGVKPANYTLRIAILGDDNEAKLKLMRSLYSAAPSEKDADSCVFEVKTVRVPAVDGTKSSSSNNNNTATASMRTVELFVPPTEPELRPFREELLHCCDCAVVLYSVKDRGSFESCKTEWAPTVQAAVEVRKRELRHVLKGSDDAAAWSASSSSAVGASPAGIPIVLVGTEAEVRTVTVGQHAIAVTSRDAVQLAQQIGALKYVEVFSDNAQHSRVVLQQAVNATDTFYSEFPLALMRSRRRAQVLREILRSAPPVVAFDLVTRRLQIAKEPRVVYCWTTDGSDPAVSLTATLAGNERSSDPEFSKPFPKCILVCCKERGKYPSIATSVQMPSEAAAPVVHVDVAWKRIVVHSSSPRASSLSGVGEDEHQRGEVQLVRYTVDGSEPTLSSAPYVGPILLDAGGSNARSPRRQSHQLPFEPWQSSNSSATVVYKFASFAAGKFRSKVQTIEVPPILETPKVSYSGLDGTLKVDMLPHCEYRYTLDGSMPSLDACSSSMVYTRPVMIPRDAPVRSLRVAAFPKLCFPSRECIVDIAPPTVHHRDPASRTIATTKTSLSRTEHARAKRQAAAQEETAAARGDDAVIVATRTPRRSSPSAADKSGHHATTNRSRDNSPATHRASGERSTSARRQQQAHARAAATTSSPTPLHRRLAESSNNSSARPPIARTGSDPTPPRRAATPPNKKNKNVNTFAVEERMKPNNNSSVKCVAADNVVSFTFPEPISLSHITVSTPGDSTGPSSYDVEVLHANATQFMAVGSGVLDDIAGVQTMHVVPNARMLPIVGVRCVFAGDGGFRVKDMKIHGKPFAK